MLRLVQLSPSLCLSLFLIESRSLFSFLTTRTFNRDVVPVKIFSLRTKFQRFFLLANLSNMFFYLYRLNASFCTRFSLTFAIYRRLGQKLNLISEKQLVFESVSDRISILVSLLTTMTFDRGVVFVKNFSLRINFQRFSFSGESFKFVLLSL